jgi:uncharacterized protein (DUF1330 family)
MGTFVINDPEIFYEDFLNKVLPDCKKAGANVVAASPAIDKFRGMWNAGYFMLCQWKSEQDFFAYNNSCKSKSKSKCIGLTIFSPLTLQVIDKGKLA